MKSSSALPVLIKQGLYNAALHLGDHLFTHSVLSAARAELSEANGQWFAQSQYLPKKKN